MKMKRLTHNKSAHNQQEEKREESWRTLNIIGFSCNGENL